VVSGTVCWDVGTLAPPERTELEVLRDASTDSVIEVSMKTIAEIVVILESSVAAPRGPKAVWLPPPPKAPARSALFPLWRRTTKISTMETVM
jgi:hypothetical protein